MLADPCVADGGGRQAFHAVKHLERSGTIAAAQLRLKHGETCVRPVILNRVGFSESIERCECALQVAARGLGLGPESQQPRLAVRAAHETPRKVHGFVVMVATAEIPAQLFERWSIQEAPWQIMPAC